ncbi:MAG: hypothetical protein ABIK36_18970 [Pseudomonadota bacterium]
MGRKVKGGTDVLDSIVATLLSLALLAERAAGRSRPVRRRALWYIWQADAVLREFVAGSEWNTAGRLWSPALPAVRCGTDPEDAFALAVSLRALALVVMNMAAQCRLSLSSEARDDAARDSNAPQNLDAVIQGLRKTVFRAVELRDTS